MEYKFVRIFLLVYNHLKFRIVVFLLSKNEPFLSTEGAGPLSYNAPCFYSSPEQTNQTTALEMGFGFASTIGSRVVPVPMPVSKKCL